MDLQLKNKKALVLGSSSGLGKAIAQSLINEGAIVALCSRDQAKLKNTAAELGARHLYACDLTKSGEAKRVAELALKDMDGLDILITNTGGPKRGHFLEISQEQWMSDYQSIWMSVVETMQVALPAMKKNNFGRVIMVTSFAARDPRPGLTTSNGLRAGLTGLCRSVAQEYAPFGITLNLLLPGYTDTERLKELKLTDEKVKSMVPAGRLGQPSELADLATFLCSPRAGYITGQSITVSGGA